MSRSSLRSRGFTLVELLTVLSLTAVLMALLFPAIALSRAQSRSAQCKNNLKNIAIAMHNYHETHGVLPPGWINHHPHPGSGPGYGWQTMLLPFVEEYALYDQLDFNEPFHARAQRKFDEKGKEEAEAEEGDINRNFPDDPKEKIHPLFQTSIEVYRCPNDPTPDLNAYRGGYATSNYSGNFGDQPLPRWDAGRASGSWPGIAPTPRSGTGILWLNSSVRFRDIKDGTSNTFMIGERASSSGAGIWPGVSSNEFENDQVTDTSYRSPLNGSRSSFSSHHSNGAYFALCDGAVRMVSDKIDTAATPGQPATYQLLGHRNDRTPIPEF